MLFVKYSSIVTGMLRSTDADLSTTYVTNLSTPLGIYGNAMLRSSDLKAIDVVIPKNKAIKLFSLLPKLNEEKIKMERTEEEES